MTDNSASPTSEGRGGEDWPFVPANPLQDCDSFLERFYELFMKSEVEAIASNDLSSWRNADKAAMRLLFDETVTTLRATLAQKDEEIKRLKSEQDKVPCEALTLVKSSTDVAPQEPKQ